MGHYFWRGTLVSTIRLERPHKAAIEWMLVALAGACGVLLLHRHTLASGGARLPGDLGDTRLNLLFLEHGFRTLRGDSPWHSFWSPTWSFFPLTEVLARSDNLIGDLPLYVTLRGLGVDPPRAFSAWVVSCTILNFAGALWAARQLGQSRLGAGASAVLFAFAMPRAQQLNHAQLLPQFWMPLCVGVLARSVRAALADQPVRSRRWLFLLPPLALLQFAAGAYLGCFLALGAVFAGVVALSCTGDVGFRAPLVRWLQVAWPGLASGLAAIAVPTWWLLRPYVRLRALGGGRSHVEVAAMLPRPLSYLMPMPGAVFYDWLTPVARTLPLSWEHTMFAGLLPLGALGWLAWQTQHQNAVGQRVLARLLFGTWALTVLSTLLLGRESAWWIVSLLPGLTALRAVTRIALLQLLLAGFALGALVTACQQRRTKGAWILATALMFLPLIENLVEVPANLGANEILERTQTLAAHVREANCSAFFYTGAPDALDVVTQLDAMSASMETGRPTINGYTGKDPEGWTLREPAHVDRAAVRDWLHRNGDDHTDFCLLTGG